MLKELKQLAEAAKIDPAKYGAHNIEILQAFQQKATPETILIMIAVMEEMAELLPQELPGNFVGMGKYYAEEATKFAPPYEEMSKFKLK
jgi:hypothetical protein